MQTIVFWPKTILGPSFFFFFFNPKTVSSPVKNKVKIRFFDVGWQWHASGRCNFIFTALWITLKYFYPITSNLQNYMKIEYKLQANLHRIKPTKKQQSNNMLFYSQIYWDWKVHWFTLFTWLRQCLIFRRIRPSL